MGSQPSWPPFQPSQDCTQGFCSVYCPQWCYFLFPPPPSLDADSSSGPTISPLGIALIALAAAAFILVGYYTIVYRHCRRVRHHPTTPPTTSTDTSAPADAPPDGLDEALINKITVHRYRRGDGLVGGTNCSVCLTEFRDDDNLRLLPRCSHAFHVPCIDKWLKSHPNCPLCRAGIVWGGPPARVAPASIPPVPQVAIEMRESGTSLAGAGEESAKHGGQREIHDVIEVSRSFESTASSTGVSSTARR